MIKLNVQCNKKTMAQPGFEYGHSPSKQYSIQ